MVPGMVHRDTTEFRIGAAMVHEGRNGMHAEAKKRIRG